ncbi:hypothetical protein Tco_0888430 [Tanacetum coccineum]
MSSFTGEFPREEKSILEEDRYSEGVRAIKVKENRSRCLGCGVGGRLGGQITLSGISLCVRGTSGDFTGYVSRTRMNVSRSESSQKVMVFDKRTLYLKISFETSLSENDLSSLEEKSLSTSKRGLEKIVESSQTGILHLLLISDKSSYSLGVGTRFSTLDFINSSDSVSGIVSRCSSPVDPTP